MKYLILITVFLTSGVFAQDESKHQISFGESGFGWNGIATRAETDDDLGIKAYDITEGNFNINYMYHIIPKTQIGFGISSKNDETELKYTSGGKYTKTTEVTSINFLITQNFSDNLNDSFYLTFFVGQVSSNIETKDTSDDTESESEYKVKGYGLSLGKRFPLTKFNIQNFTYSPQITIASGKVSGDLEDAGVETLTQFQIDILKFDLLF